MTRSHDKVKDISNVSRTDINKTSINSSFCVDIASKKTLEISGSGSLVSREMANESFCAGTTIASQVIAPSTAKTRAR